MPHVCPPYRPLKYWPDSRTQKVPRGHMLVTGGLYCVLKSGFCVILYILQILSENHVILFFQHQMDPSSNFYNYRTALRGAAQRSLTAHSNREKVCYPNNLANSCRRTDVTIVCTLDLDKSEQMVATGN